jgi:hypothetical protein
MAHGNLICNESNDDVIVFCFLFHYFLFLLAFLFLFFILIIIFFIAMMENGKNVVKNLI